jgi:uncharacterized membrane protein
MESRLLLRSLGIGATCGLRSMTGPAVVRWRRGDRLRLAYAALAAGELIADKLPATPPRTIPPALLFRLFSGGVTGAQVAESPDSRLQGALLGAVGAGVAAYAGLALRSALVKLTGIADPIVALGEDALAVGGALALTRGVSSA